MITSRRRPWLAIAGGVLVVAGTALIAFWVTAMLRDGHRAEGVFTTVTPRTGDTTSMFEAVKYTISFADHTGEPHQITGEKFFRSSRIPQPGDTVALCYDPDRPHRHILV
ncbi:hypothetical protein [Actinokineospora sp. NPDC004072]